MYTIHSEVATLPLSYAKKGVKEVSFKIAFDPEFTDRVRFLRDLGLGSHDEITVGQGTRVRPIDVVNKIAMNQPPVKQVGKLKQYEVVRAIVKGAKKGKKLTWIADCHTSGMPEWGVGLDIDTGSPPAVAAQMIASGEVTEKGAIPAEIAIDPKLFFKHLKRRKMTVKTQKKTGWKFAT
jgi:saccharopine dehydrogenase-like NADP-dependent oxidoreductase